MLLLQPSIKDLALQIIFSGSLSKPEKRWKSQDKYGVPTKSVQFYSWYTKTSAQEIA
jgi:hypothetical protein